MRDQDLLWQLPGAIHTFKRDSYVGGGQETRRKNLLVFTYLPFPKRDERARALQISTTLYGQSSVLLAGDTLQGSFLPQEHRGDRKLGHLVIRKPRPCETVIPSLLSFNKHQL